ncbi:type II/IV secretion system ATPase subunit [Natrialbaceae archaeon A-gly3]
MAIDETDGPDTPQLDGEVSGSESEASGSGEPTEDEAGEPPSGDDQERTPESEHEPGETDDSAVRVGDYTWADFMEEYGYGEEVSTLYPEDDTPDDQLGLDTDGELETTVPSGTDWERVEFDPEEYLGYHPDDLPELITETLAPNAKYLQEVFLEYVDPETTPVVKDVYTWEHYKWEYYYDEDGSRPRKSDGSIDRFDQEEALGFDPEELEGRLSAGDGAAMALDDVVEERTVNVQEDLDEDDFFSTAAGHTTVSNRYDLEKAVPMAKKLHFREVERYWVNKPYTFVIIFHSEKENEKKYYVIEPFRTELEEEVQEFLSGKLRAAIKYTDDDVKHHDEDGKRAVIEEEARHLLERYDLFEKGSSSAKAGLLETIRTLLDDEEKREESGGGLEGISARPEPVLLEEDSDTLNEYQVEKLLYLLKRDFIGYERIDGIKHDINVEDISCDGYNSPVFVYHSEYEQIISNVYHGEKELDDFVVKLAQRSGKGISKRLPQVDATLPDGSRAQLTLGTEVSDHGTNYTIRQFKDVPFTPVDLINWNTFSLDEMAFLWLCIENHKSLIFAGGTASGKTTSLNAVSLFIPSNTKIVSIEDTREVELPQRNWIASITRPSFSDDDQGDVDEFDLLEAALRQRPDYIVMGEIRGEEGRTLFQVMSTGHTTYTTFHADSVDEVLKRFTTDPINVSKTMFTALDLVSIQTQTRVQGRKVRRNKSLTEINHYEAENDEINVQDVYQWQAETDEYLKMGDSNTLETIKFDRGWKQEKLEEELFKRRVILAYLIKNGLNTYAEVAATVQAYINDSETILTLIANGQLEASLDDLREMESVLIDVDQEKEELVPRPDASDETYNLSVDILERAEESLFEEYRGEVPSGLSSALGEVEEAEQIEVDRADADEFDFGGELDESSDESDWELGDGTVDSPFDSEQAQAPSWLEDDDGFDVEDNVASAEDSVDTGAGEDQQSQPATETERTEEPAQPALEAAPSAVTDEVPSKPGTDEKEDESPTSQPPESDDEGEGVPDGETPPDDQAVGSSAVGTAPSPESPSSDDSEDLEGLFEDMGDTLEELEAVEADESDADTNAEPSNTDDLFADQDFDSVFADDSTAGLPAEESMDDTDEQSIFAADDTEPDLEFDEETGDGASATDSGESSTDESGSIFGETAEPVFDDEADDGGGSGLFEETEPSPFEPATVEEDSPTHDNDEEDDG